MQISDLFETPPYLEQKLGAELFEDIPQQPGIYRFYDDEETLLYVGKAKNLRHRLFTYKIAKPGKTSRKEAALISQIHRFEFDILDSEEEAILQENRWIRERRPEFNHANKRTETYYFITVQWSDSVIVFGLSMNPSGQLFPEIQKPLYQDLNLSLPKDFESKIYGCYKGHRTVRSSFGALLQLLWMAEFGSKSPHFLPIQLSRNLAPMRFQFPIQNQKKTIRDELRKMLDSWFLGNSSDLLDYLQQKIQNNGDSIFATNFIRDNIEILDSYFLRNLNRYRMMRELKQNKKSHLIGQDELDDLIAKVNANQLQTKDN